MNKKQQILLYCLNLIYDSFLLFLFVLLFHKGTDWRDFALYLGINLLFCLISGFLFQSKPSMLKGLFFINAIIGFGLFWSVGNPWLLSAILALVLSWRGTVNWEDPLKPDLEAILFISGLAVVLLSLFPNQGSSLLYGVVWFQFVMMLLIKTVLQYVQSNHTNQTKWFLRELTLPGLLLIAGMSMFIFMGPIRSLLLFLFNGLFYIFYYVLAVPLWKLFQMLSVPLHFIMELFQGTQRGKPGKSPPPDKKYEHLVHLNNDWLLWTCVTILVLAVLIYIYRKKIFRRFDSNSIVRGSISTLDQSGINESALRKRSWLKSKDRTRKRFLQFEKSLLKRGFFRSPGESPQKWFQRLQLAGYEAETVLKSYEKVRYGDRSLSDDEFQSYSKAIKEIEKTPHLQKKKKSE